jgi:hypothetical protein
MSDFRMSLQSSGPLHEQNTSVPGVHQKFSRLSAVATTENVANIAASANPSSSGSLTGKAYYETCWELRNKTKGFSEPTPSTPYQAGQWKQCEPVAQRAIYNSGLMFAGTEDGEEAERLRRACPDKWSEVPMSGVFYLYVNEGGVSGIFSFLPAAWSISHWATKRWPRCISAACISSCLNRRPIGRFVAFDHRSGSFVFLKTGILACE